MIQSFADKALERFFWTGEFPSRAGWQKVSRIVQRKLDMLDQARVLEDLRVPPGNRLELLSGDLAGCYSIRVDGQWRVVFEWTTEGPDRVRVVDYH